MKVYWCGTVGGDIIHDLDLCYFSLLNKSTGQKKTPVHARGLLYFLNRIKKLIQNNLPNFKYFNINVYVMNFMNNLNT